KYARTTGVVQWMLNNAWPSLIWHLYDWYLRPGGSYFGAKKANEPLHLQYSYGDQAISLVNSTYSPTGALKAEIEAYAFELRPPYSRPLDASAAADSSVDLMTLPAIPGLTTTWFLRLRLLSGDAPAREISNNFYWLSTKKEVLDWAKTDFALTPTLQDAD